MGPAHGPPVVNDGGWWAGARLWWANRSLYKRFEATRHWRGDREAASSDLGWRHVAFTGVMQAIEVFGVLALFIGVIFLLIWLFD